MFTVILNTTIASITAMQLRLPNQIIFIYDKENLCNFLVNSSYDNFTIMDAFTCKYN